MGPSRLPFNLVPVHLHIKSVLFCKPGTGMFPASVGILAS